VLSTSTRLVVGIVSVVLLIAGLGLIAVGPVAGVSGFWVTLTGAALLISLAVERNRYRSDDADRSFEPVGPGGGEPSFDLEPRFRPTDETFVDPTTNLRMRVYLDRRTGERRYVADA
jgi:hypothetical protein